MCEVCRVRAGTFWVRRDSMNLIVCGVHLVATIKRFHATDPKTAPQTYHLTDHSSVRVKMRVGKGWR